MSEPDAEGLQGEQAGGDDAATGGTSSSTGAASTGASSLNGAGLGSTDASASRPEMAVGAAFAGGFLLALLLRRVRS